MRVKKIVFIIALIVVSFILCSKLDTYTGVGSKIIEDTDKSLLDFSGRFFPLIFDSSQIVLEDGSLPDTTGRRFGYLSDYLIVGSRADVYYYGVSNFVFLYKDIKKRLLSTIVKDTLDSIAIVYNIQLDTIIGTTIANTTNLSLILCDTSTIQRLPEDATSKYNKAGVEWTITSDSMLIGKISDSILVDSIFSLCKHPFTDSSDTGWRREINLSLFNLENNLMLLDKNSYLLIYTRSHKDGKSRVDTIYSYSFSMASEKNSLIEELKLKRVSSIPAKRTTVFKMDFSRLWDTLETASTNEILSASLVIGIDTISEINRDTVVFAVCFVADSLYKDAKDLSYQLDTLYKYHIEYVKIDPSKDSLVFFPIHKQLQYYKQKKSDILYVYIQLLRVKNRENYSIYWKKPSIKILLTQVN
ncbi:MAG: hypothetical protein N2053_10740 [Chitinispirillaceae bacterium]|nr:hypothetical protein [Chitinispirillaceae bacterium]